MAAASGGIAGGHELTCEVAIDVLRAGGNAADAAVAAFAAMFITEPAMASPGGGGFATVAGPQLPAQVFDFFCHTPITKRPVEQVEYRPITVDFGDDTELFYAGNGSAATPGSIAGIFALHKSFGTLPLKDLFAPAITLMKSGVALNSFQHFDLTLLKEILLLEPEGRAIFLQEGQFKREGDVVMMPQLADFMEVLALEGQDMFYRGEVARECAAIHKDRGGLLRREDFEKYECKIRTPRQFTLGDWKFSTVPGPFLGGAIFEFVSRSFASHRAAYDNFYAAIYEAIWQVLPMQKDQARLDHSLSRGLPPMPDRRGATSHFSVTDRDGLAVSLTTSIGEGSGLFLPSSGVHLNNMLGELALLPGDLHSWWPDQRLNSMMSPTIGRHKDGSIWSMGTGGAGRIPFVLAQVVGQKVWGLDESLQELITRPRIFATEDVLHYERPIDPFSWARHHNNRKVWSPDSLFFGGVNTVMHRGNHFEGAADHRRQGVVKLL